MRFVVGDEVVWFGLGYCAVSNVVLKQGSYHPTRYPAHYPSNGSSRYLLDFKGIQAEVSLVLKATTPSLSPRICGF